MYVRHATVETELGPITIVADGEALTGLYFRDHVRRPDEGAFGAHVPAAEDPLLAEAADQLWNYLGGRRMEFDLPLRAAGDEFQRAVWSIVAAIPAGRTVTYGQIAEQVGGRSLAQAVGQAVGANPLCIFVPCHRVVGAGGALTGYAGGLVRKRALLELEQVAVGVDRLF